MNCLLRTVGVLIVGAILSHAQTAVVFGATGAVGSEILQSLLNGNESGFDEVFLIGRRSSPKVDDMLSKKKEGAPNVIPVILADLSADLASYDNIRSADACFVAIGVGDINKMTLQAWHSVEVDLIASVARFCDKLHVSTLTLLSAVDVEYESVVPYSEDELHSENQKPLGWIKSVFFHYNRVKGLEEKAAIDATGNDVNIRLFQPSSIVTGESRYGMVDRLIFRFHKMFDPYIPTKYHSVDIKLLGMAMVLDAEKVLLSMREGNVQEEGRIAKLTYADFLNVAGKVYDDQHQQKRNEL